jgi:uncharacterized membrane protein
MVSPRLLFHRISYLQYPIIASSLIFYIPFVTSLASGNPNWLSFNNFLVLIGVALSFSTLQDTTKTQNKLSRKVWESPRKGKIALIFYSLMAFIMIFGGVTSFFLIEGDGLETISVGVTVLGIGLMGLLKSAIEMFENHRLDKKKTVSEESVNKKTILEFDNTRQ